MNRRNFLSFFGIAPAALVLPKVVVEPVKAVAVVRYSLGTFTGSDGSVTQLWDYALRMSDGTEHSAHSGVPRGLPVLDGGSREPTAKELETMEQLTRQRQRDGAWIASAQLRNALDDAFVEQLRFSLVDGGETWGLRVYTEDREIFLAAETTVEDAITAVRLMLGCRPGSFTPIYVGGRVGGITQER